MSLSRGGDCLSSLVLLNELLTDRGWAGKNELLTDRGWEERTAGGGGGGYFLRKLNELEPSPAQPSPTNSYFVCTGQVTNKEGGPRLVPSELRQSNLG